jgi:hypothetical protein
MSENRVRPVVGERSHDVPCPQAVSWQGRVLLPGIKQVRTPSVRRKQKTLLGANRAHKAVQYAVKIGKLPNLKVEFVKCSDCDKRATRYDHRDYSKPLDVVPVCHGCNLLRGAAGR